jgi:hypothetical protein
VSNSIVLEFCTVEHFAFNDQLRAQFVELGIEEWLCPPLDYQMKLKGRLSSAVSKRLEVVVRRCDPDNNDNCAGDANVSTLENQLGSF